VRKIRFRRKLFIDNILVTIVLLVLLCSISIGYAYYEEELDINGLVVISSNEYVGILDVVSVSVGDSYNSSYTYNTYYRSSNDTSVTFSISNTITFNSGSGDYLEYIVNIYNDSSDTYTYNGFSNSGYSNPWFYINTPRVLGIEKGDVIRPGKSKTIRIIYYYDGSLENNSTLYYQDYLVFLVGNQDISKNSVAGKVNTNIIKTDSKTNLFNLILNISNNYEVSVKYKVMLSNSDISLVDSSLNKVDYIYYLDKSSTNSNTIYLALNNNLQDGESITTDIYIVLENGDIVTIDNVKIYVPEKDENGNSTEEEDSSIEGFNIETNIEERTGWSYHYKVNVNVSNSNDYDLEEWTIKIKLDDTVVIDQYTTYLPNNYKATVKDNTIIIVSTQKWSSNNNVISSNSTLSIDEFTLGISSNEFNLPIESMVKSVVIYPYVEEIGS
jgi:hypothetical protein